MKAEDIAQAWDAAIRSVESYPHANNTWELKSPIQREALKALARACEQHGVERAKASARLKEIKHNCGAPDCYLTVIDLSALDAAIRKENEGE